MNKNTVYVLQKDLPFAKAGVDFIRENEDADYYNTNFASYHDRLHKSRVENNPEWFKPKEQVNESKPTEQPLWEILSYINPNVVTDVVGGNIVYAKWSGAIYAILKNFPIHSVKRLRDNTVWIVDMVTGNGKITGFHIEKGIMVAEFENNTRHCDLMLLTEAPKEEQVPIKVSHITSHDAINFRDKTVYSHAVWVSQPIPESKYQPIREAIERELNNDTSLPLPLIDDRQLFSMNDIASCYESPKNSPLYNTFQYNLYRLLEKKIANINSLNK